jgi:hypothetical protein
MWLACHLGECLTLDRSLEGPSDPKMPQHCLLSVSKEGMTQTILSESAYFVFKRRPLHLAAINHDIRRHTWPDLLIRTRHYSLLTQNLDEFLEVRPGFCSSCFSIAPSVFEKFDERK